MSSPFLALQNGPRQWPPGFCLESEMAFDECRVRKDHWKGMSAMEKSAIAQQQVQQVAEKKARQQQLLHEDWQYARAQADIARNMASQANQVSMCVQDYVTRYQGCVGAVAGQMSMVGIRQMCSVGKASSGQCGAVACVHTAAAARCAVQGPY